uniref:Uncharacterized protein n=1 Tax=Arundo donax TaxID=35708 RepID=A0A0A8Z6X0_ARUDO
MALHYINTK